MIFSAYKVGYGVAGAVEDGQQDRQHCGGVRHAGVPHTRQRVRNNIYINFSF